MMTVNEFIEKAEAAGYRVMPEAKLIDDGEGEVLDVAMYDDARGGVAESYTVTIGRRRGRVSVMVNPNCGASFGEGDNRVSVAAVQWIQGYNAAEVFKAAGLHIDGCTCERCSDCDD